MLMVGFHGTELSDDLRALLDETDVMGVIWFRRNVTNVDQVARVNEALHRRRPDLIVAVDQEGGPVRRLRDGVTPVPAMRDVQTVEDALAWGHTLGRELRALGFDLNFAPVLDVDSNPDNPIIGARSFGPDPLHVSRMAVALHEGLVAEGVASCGKHFPGHGDTNLDSHLDLPTLPHALDRLLALELVPFRAAVDAGFPSIMSAHVVFEALDAGPATLSRPVLTGLLRDALGYDGVVFTDDLEMKAIADRYSVEAVVEGAIDAGVDVLLMCHDLEKQWAVLKSLATTDTGEARRRVAALVDRFRHV